jgi:quinol---cytochrome c reductase iron-sulfur subunit, bacillus type
VENQENITRRRWLVGIFWGAISLVGAGIGLPLIIYFCGPILRKTRTRRIKLGRVGDFAAGVPQRVEVTYYRVSAWITESARQIAWVVRRSESAAEFDVFDPHCTHLGCAYNWVAEANEFQCPCHNGKFSAAGCVMGGPPPRPLDIYEYEVENGILYAKPVPDKNAFYQYKAKQGILYGLPVPGARPACKSVKK